MKPCTRLMILWVYFSQAQYIFKATQLRNACYICSPLLLYQITTNLVSLNNWSVLSYSSEGKKSKLSIAGLKSRYQQSFPPFLVLKERVLALTPFLATRDSFSDFQHPSYLWGCSWLHWDHLDIPGWAQEGLEELSHVEGQEGRWWGDTPHPR